MTNGRFTSKEGWIKNAKAGGRLLRRGIVGAGGAAALGAVALAAGMASGDIEKGLKSGLGGAAAGFVGANALADKGMKGAGKYSREFNKGYLGAEEYNNRLLDREYYASEEWREARREGVGRDEMQAYRNHGVTDTKAITKLHKAGFIDPEVGHWAIRIAGSMTSSDMRDPVQLAHCEAECKAKDPSGSMWAAVQKLKRV